MRENGRYMDSMEWHSLKEGEWLSLIEVASISYL